MKRFCTILLLLLFVPLLRAVEYTPAQVPNVHQTDGRRFVSNPDGILSPETVDTLDRTLFGLQEATTSEVAVAAFPPQPASRMSARASKTDSIDRFISCLPLNGMIGASRAF